MRIQMVKDGMKLNIYDDFGIGVMEDTSNAQDEFLNLTFGENDREEIHVFKVHKDKIDDFIDMVRTHSGKRVHIPTEQEIPRGVDLRKPPR